MTGRVKEREQRRLSQNDREINEEVTETVLSQNGKESKGVGTEGVYLRMTDRVKEWEQRGLSQNDRESKGEGTEGVISE